MKREEAEIELLKLEGRISQLLREFHKKTGIEPEAISVRDMTRISDRVKHYAVHIKTKLLPWH